MNVSYYVGDGTQEPRETPLALPTSRRAELQRPERYLADPGLVDACNVALLLGQPLLLTGAPGTGKTMFAYSVASELGYEPPLKFETKSTSSAGDLFYTYDALRHFQDAQNKVASGPLDYITYHALGTALLWTQPRSKVQAVLPEGFEHKGPCRSVVLIDEVDKAPRDFPNDILNELDQMYFRVSQLGNARIDGDPALAPIVVITSNSEKDLPDAFLRRCIYYDIPFPERDRLERIVSARLGLYADASDPFLTGALDLFERLRSTASNLRKKPATAELLDWLVALRTLSQDAQNPLEQPERALATLSSLVKTASDQAKATEIVRQWVQEQT